MLDEEQKQKDIDLLEEQARMMKIEEEDEMLMNIKETKSLTIDIGSESSDN